MKGEREQVEVTAPAARKLSGAVIFAGGIWYRPDYRSIGLPYILPWLSRAYAYTRWKHDFSCSIMAEEVYKRGMAAAQRLQQGGLGSLAAAHAGRSRTGKSAARSSTWMPASCSTAPPTS